MSMPAAGSSWSVRMRESDPATFEVVKNALYCAAEEMKVVLAKTAYSPLLKVAGDYSCGLFDVRGEMVAQGPDLPIHLGSMPLAVKAVIQASPSFEPGDVFIHNDPYFGGSHLPDVNVVTPAFHEGRLLGFACVRAHWPDIGSGTPGSYGASTEIYGEGLRLPPVRLYAAGVLNREVDAIIFTNVRTPEERRGDLRAQLAGHHRRGDPPLRAGATPRRGAAAGDHAGGNGLLRAHDARAAGRAARRCRAVRGLLRRRRRARERRQGRPAVLDPHARGQARRPAHGGLHGNRSAGGRPDERAAERDGLRHLLCDQDDRRPGGSRSAQLRLLAPDRAARRAGDGGERGGAGAGGLRQPRDQPPRVRHAVRRDGPPGARARDGLLAGDLR